MHDDLNQGATPGVDQRIWRLGGLIFLQMLPATLVAPAIRPLFAAQHAGNEGAMHAFMALNMVGAIIATPFIGALADRAARPRLILAALAAIDALLLWAVSTPSSAALVLSLRLVEGAAHVGAASLLLAEAAALSRLRGDGRVMGIAGFCLMLSIALGSFIGGQLLAFGPQTPFLAGAALAGAVALFVATQASKGLPRVAPPAASAGSVVAGLRRLAIPLSAAFVGRFTVGCIVVTFALFAHRAHGLSDATVGVLFTLLTLPFALFMYPMARLGDRLPRAKVLTAGVVTYGLALAGLGWIPTWGLFPLMLVAGVASSMIFAPTLCYAAALAPEDQRGRAMAFLNGAGAFGMVLGPAAAGITSALLGREDPLVGYRAAFLVATGSLALWLLLSATWLRQRAREEAQTLSHAQA